MQGILNRFIEYIAQVDLQPNHHQAPSQLYMLNVFREYNTLRELRVVFDYIFHLITDLIGVEKKGVFLLANEESEFFDMVLGYGFETRHYREICEELVPSLKEHRVHSVRKLTVLHRRDLFEEKESFFQEDFYLLLPLVRQDRIHGLILLLSLIHI